MPTSVAFPKVPLLKWLQFTARPGEAKEKGRGEGEGEKQITPWYTWNHSWAPEKHSFKQSSTFLHTLPFAQNPSTELMVSHMLAYLFRQLKNKVRKPQIQSSILSIRSLLWYKDLSHSSYHSCLHSLLSTLHYTEFWLPSQNQMLKPQEGKVPVIWQRLKIVLYIESHLQAKIWKRLALDFLYNGSLQWLL